MSIPAIGGVTSVAPTAYLSALTGADTAAPASDGSAFASVLGSIDSLQGLQATSNELAVRAVTGDLDDVHDYTVAAAEASLTLELTAALRNKAVDAFTEIMRMQA
ncbi:flagellar hook-basal body complex protein FliE [Cellulomonas chengniuliangii]|uniref:Flagellar hook-basal body complex protein FliE n=1 Tax=Cellulomonas chengniuliangii TaxID=2968084 RepID=A0ABY5L5R8_9CELL|nr:flagellar hook-basal body complex protein FliE [Cellulomonas chengniuliangii]MCC2307270.1 flagellar hook-basal body complex protein FliE [Cellulomonas chengniuliangii]MCC2317834.1 flagellar hook-basal body complex protein FliE [Cellulomonas chengniuliangii]UUI75938.1 flagellar hook-basal body complex protein FliE [Cellulomonas chengniuliangii]